MRERWEELAAHLNKARGFWRSADKLKAIRLLGRQPVDAPDDVRVAAVFLASHAIRRTGKPFEDLLSDMPSETLSSWVKDVTDRSEAEGIDVSDVTKARQILLDLVEENVAMIDEALARHEANAQKKGAKSSDRLGFDESPRSLRIGKYEAKCVSGYVRGLELYRKWQKREGRERRAEGGGGSGEQERRLRPTDYGRATRAESGGGSGADDVASGAPWDDQMPGDRDGEGLVGESGDLSANGVETGAGEWVAADAAVNSCAAADGASQVSADFRVSSDEAANGTRNVPATKMEEVESAVAVAHGVSSDEAADGAWNVPATKMGDSGGSTAGAQVGCSDDEECGGVVGSTEDRGGDKNDGNVTNEPNFEKEVAHTQDKDIVAVAADSGGVSGLDKVRTNPPQVGPKTWQDAARERLRRENERKAIEQREGGFWEAARGEPFREKIADATGSGGGLRPLPRSP